MSHTSASSYYASTSRIMRLHFPLLLCILACCIPLLPHINVNAATATSKVALIEQRGICSTQLMEAAEVAYSIARPDMNITGSTQTVPAMVISLYSPSPLIDFYVAGQKPDAVSNPLTDGLVNSDLGKSIASFPIGASAVVPIYNLPGISIPLILSRQALVDLFLGNIVNWNDTRLTSTNPNIVLPNQPIIIIHPVIASIQTLVLTQALSKFNSTQWFNDIPGPVKDTCNWPFWKYASYKLVTGSMASNTLTIPYSLSYSLISNAVPLGVQRASMINKAGQIVSAGTYSLNYAFMELGTKLNQVSGLYEWNNDLSDGSGYETWPMAFSLAAYLPLQLERTTCMARTEVINFFLWFLSSTVVKNLAQSLSLTILPPLVFTQLDLDTFLRYTLKCSSTSTLQTTSQNQIAILGSNLASLYSDLTSSYVSFYGATDRQYYFKYGVQNEFQAIQQLSLGEIDASVIVPRQFELMNPGVINSFTYNPDADPLADDGSYVDPADAFSFLPWQTYGVQPMHSIPQAVKDTYLKWPLTLDLDTLGKIFALNITKWDHPAVEALNPGLSAIFRSTNSSTIISLVICCQSTLQASPSTNSFVSTLNYSSPTFTAIQKWKFPVDWTKTLTNAKKPTVNVSIVNVAAETQLESAIIRTNGSIGYILSYSKTFDPKAHIQIKLYTDVSALQAQGLIDMGNASTLITSTVKPSLSGLRSCIRIQPVTLTTDYAQPVVPPTVENYVNLTKCWPFRIATSVVIPTQYTTTTNDQCVRANHTINLIRWLLNDPKLDTSANLRGVVRLGTTMPLMADLQNGQLNSLTCNGETMQVVQPHIWVLNSSITNFAWALCAIGLVSIAIACMILGIYRHRAVLRSSSVPFQFIILFGLTIMFISIGIFGLPATTQNCQSLAWLLNIGFTFMFGPLFAKMWRIYKIFDRRILKVVKISNEKLAGLVGLMVLADIIINTVWQLYSPVYASTINRLENGKSWQYTQCGGDSGSLPFLILICCLKFSLLVFGSYMGFTTRNVMSTFNESKNVAWCIYNVFFITAVIVPVLIFSGSIGDVFTLLIVFLLFWIAACTLGMNFGPKFIVLWKTENHDNNNTNNNSALSIGGGGNSMSTGDMGIGSVQLFTFPSIIDVPKNILDKYISALEVQCRIARMRHKLLVESGMGGHTNAVAGDNNQHQGGKDMIGTGIQGSYNNETGNNHSGLGMKQRRVGGNNDFAPVEKPHGAYQSQILSGGHPFNSGYDTYADSTVVSTISPSTIDLRRNSIATSPVTATATSTRSAVQMVSMEKPMHTQQAQQLITPTQREGVSSGAGSAANSSPGSPLGIQPLQRRVSPVVTRPTSVNSSASNMLSASSAKPARFSSRASQGMAEQAAAVDRRPSYGGGNIQSVPEESGGQSPPPEAFHRTLALASPSAVSATPSMLPLSPPLTVMSNPTSPIAPLEEDGQEQEQQQQPATSSEEEYKMELMDDQAATSSQVNSESSSTHSNDNPGGSSSQLSSPLFPHVSASPPQRIKLPSMSPPNLPAIPKEIQPLMPLTLESEPLHQALAVSAPLLQQQGSSSSSSAAPVTDDASMQWMDPIDHDRALLQQTESNAPTGVSSPHHIVDARD